MFTIIAVDISGRHRIDAGYYMVCAAASLEMTPTAIEKINEINTEAFLYHKPAELPDVVKIIETTAAKIKKKGPLIVERGDLFNLDEDLAQAMFSDEIRYQESIGERKAIELAHHVSLSTRNLLLRETGIDIRIYEEDSEDENKEEEIEEETEEGEDAE